jgi:putative transposase
LIFQVVAASAPWDAPRIHGELRMLGFVVSERTISCWMRRAPRNPEPAQRWRAFLRNHREAIAAMDFFTVPTLTFNLIYCFFVIRHDRRRILHFNITRHQAPNSENPSAFTFRHTSAYLSDRPGSDAGNSDS